MLGRRDARLAGLALPSSHSGCLATITWLPGALS
jgi:hypothetical protein